MNLTLTRHEGDQTTFTALDDVAPAMGMIGTLQDGRAPRPCGVSVNLAARRRN